VRTAAVRGLVRIAIRPVSRQILRNLSEAADSAAPTGSAEQSGELEVRPPGAPTTGCAMRD
jgi:hypothetical protein